MQQMTWAGDSDAASSKQAESSTNINKYSKRQVVIVLVLWHDPWKVLCGYMPSQPPMISHMAIEFTTLKNISKDYNNGTKCIGW